MLRGLIIDYAGVLDGPEEELERWRALFAAIKAADVSIAILSNEPGGPEAERIREWEYRGIVDAVLMSGEIGVEKPEFGAFQAAADALDLDLNECVVVDDNIHYIRAGVDIGLVCFLHTAFDRTAVQLSSVYDLEGEF